MNEWPEGKLPTMKLTLKDPLTFLVETDLDVPSMAIAKAMVNAALDAINKTILDADATERASKMRTALGMNMAAGPQIVV